MVLQALPIKISAASLDKTPAKRNLVHRLESDDGGPWIF
jgi:hypothetical protein